MALACLTLSSSGCGYSLAGRGSFLPSYIQTIGIPTFTNRTTVFNLDAQLTDKVRSEFIGRGKYHIVTEVTGVDAVLTGEVVSVVTSPINYGNQNLASRYTLRMTARVELRDEREHKVLWQNPGLVFTQDYDAQTGGTTLDPAAFFSNDTNALDRLTSEFAKTIVSSILEAF